MSEFDFVLQALEQLTQDRDECVVLYRDGGSWWVAKTTIPMIPEPVAWGDTLPEALQNLFDGKGIGADTVLTFVPGAGR